MPDITELGNKVKAKYPQYADMDPTELGRKVKATYPNAYTEYTDSPSAPVAAASPVVPASVTPATSAAPKVGILEHLNPFGAIGNLAQGVVSGVPETASNIASGVEAAAKTVGLDGVAGVAGDVAAATKPTADPTTPTLQKVLNNEAGFLPWVGSTIGQTVAPIGALALAAAGGAATGVAAAPVIAAGAVGTLLNAGDLYSSMREKGIDAPGASIIAGIPMTALDVVEPLRLAGKLKREVVIDALQTASQSSLKRFGLGFVKEGAVESVTELGQEGISLVAESSQGVKITSQEALWRLVEAGAGGFIGAGTLGGAVRALPVKRPPSEDPKLTNPEQATPVADPVVTEDTAAVSSEGTVVPLDSADLLAQQVQTVVQEESSVPAKMPSNQESSSDLPGTDLATQTTPPDSGNGVPNAVLSPSILNVGGLPSSRDLSPMDAAAPSNANNTGTNISEENQPGPASKGVQPEEGPSSSETGSAIVEGVRSFGKAAQNWLQLRQLGYMFPDFAPLQNFVLAAERMNAHANEMKLAGDKVLDSWRALGSERAKKLGDFMFLVTRISDKKGRKLSTTELAAAASKMKLDDDTFGVFQGVQGFFNNSLEQLRAAASDDIAATLPEEMAIPAQLALDSDFKRFSNRTYFPLTRFGNYTVTVRAEGKVKYEKKTYKPGETVYFASYRNEAEAVKAKAELDKKFSGYAVSVGKDKLSEGQIEGSFLPPAALGPLASQLGLNEEQTAILRQMTIKQLPTRAFLQHMRKRRGTDGFSRDAQRAFAAYTQSIANHTAKLTQRRNLEAEIKNTGAVADQLRKSGQDAVPTRKLQERLEQQKNWMMNPSLRVSALSGALFSWFFAYVPKQALINTTQIPLFTYPHLSKMGGSVEAAKVLTSTMADVTSSFTQRMFNGKGEYTGKITPEEWEAIEHAQGEGLLEQGFAAQIAAFANGTVIEDALVGLFGTKAEDFSRDLTDKVRVFLDAGTKPFQMSEEYNRMVTFLATHRMAEKLQDRDPYKTAKDAVHQTQGSYEAFNRAPAAQGDLQYALVFKNYLMNALWYYRYAPAGRQALLALAVAGGLQGLPGAEDILDWLDTLGTWTKTFFGMKNPRVDLRTEMRKLIDNIPGVSADFVMHGVSRLPGMLFDVSSSLSMGRIVPGTQPINSALRGEVRAEQALFAAVEEAAGVTGAQSVNMAKGLLETGQDGETWRRLVLPQSLKNLDQAQLAMRQGEVRTNQGDRLIDIDVTNPWHMVELFGMSLGFVPTRMSRAREAKWAPEPLIRYYKMKEALVVGNLERAIRNKDLEAIKVAKKDLAEFREMMPPGMARSAKSIMQGVRRTQKDRRLRESGLPTERKLRRFYLEYQGAYAGVPVDPEEEE